MSSKENLGLKDGLRLLLRDSKGKPKERHGFKDEHPRIVKTDQLIEVVDEILKKDEEESYQLTLCPKCGYDKFRVLTNARIQCQKCDAFTTINVTVSKSGTRELDFVGTS